MFRVSMLLLFALVLTATGCETGSTHENKADQGLAGQNVGQSSNKSGPVPGSTTGTDKTSYQVPEQQQAPTQQQKVTASSTPSK